MERSNSLVEAIASVAASTREELLRNDPTELENLRSKMAARFAGNLDRRCSQDVLYWLQNHTRTEDPQARADGREYKAPFPRKEYFIPLFEAFAKCPRLFIQKSRTMMTSWSAMGFAAHRAQWHQEESIVQTESEDKAKELVGYCAQLWRNQDDCLRNLHPVKAMSAMEIAWSRGGRVLGIPKGESKIRMFHPSRYIQDESAFLPEGQECYDAAHPACLQIICISSAGPATWFDLQCAR